MTTDLEQGKGYYIENRITKEIVKKTANSAQEACQKAGWLIGDCWVSELGVYPFQFRLPEKETPSGNT